MYPILIKTDSLFGILNWLMIPIVGYSVRAIAIWPVILITDADLGDADLINHERIHLRQQLELLVLPFFLMYTSFWLVNKLRGMSAYDAYIQIPFEREAYNNHKDFSYQWNRSPYSWINYLTNKENQPV